MKQSRSIVFLLVVTALTITALISGYLAAAEPQAPVQREVTLILPSAADERWSLFRTGVRAAAREYDISLTIVSTNQENEEAQIESAIAAAPNGIVASLLNDSSANLLNRTSTPAVLIGTRGSLETGTRIAHLSLSARAAGVSLAQIAASDYATATDRKIGIVLSSTDSSELIERLASLNEELAKHDISAAWILKDPTQASLTRAQSEDPVNVLIALDNYALEAAADYASAHPEEINGLYGIGISNTCISYTDQEIISRMIVPNEYLAGFQAIEQIAAYCSDRTPLQDGTIDYSIIAHANMFTKKNQQLLFPIRQ